MKTRFYLIRHGETEWNKKGIYQGWTDIELSKLGELQAELLGRRFLGLPIDAIYVSPLKRAMKTAEEISRIRGIPCIQDEHFKEINFGEWEGSSVKELSDKYGAAFTNFFKDPFSYEFPGEGSFEIVKERSMKGFFNILEKHKGEHVAIVSHGGLLRVLIMEIMGMDKSFYQKTWLSNTGISIIDVYEDGRALLFSLNDKSHTDGLNLV